mgnify:CR=1 FL=1
MKKVLILVSSICLFCSASAVFGAIALTDTTNITLANSLSSTQSYVKDDSDVTGGSAGDLITYTVNSSEWAVGSYDGDQLFNGNAGPGGANTSVQYAIVGGSSGTVSFDLDGGSQVVGSLAIYNGYANRDHGDFTLRDDSGTLGAWTISTTGGSSHIGTDLFWLTFKTPVTTANLYIDYDQDDLAPPAFAAIQPFAVPELSQFHYIGIALAAGLAFRRRIKKA